MAVGSHHNRSLPCRLAGPPRPDAGVRFQRVYDPLWPRGFHRRRESYSRVRQDHRVQMGAGHEARPPGDSKNSLARRSLNGAGRRTAIPDAGVSRIIVGGPGAVPLVMAIQRFHYGILSLIVQLNGLSTAIERLCDTLEDEHPVPPSHPRRRRSPGNMGRRRPARPRARGERRPDDGRRSQTHQALGQAILHLAQPPHRKRKNDSMNDSVLDILSRPLARRCRRQGRRSPRYDQQQHGYPPDGGVRPHGVQPRDVRTREV